ncbi:hypothetical protein D3C86_2062870 [compost metagenome]
MGLHTPAAQRRTPDAAATIPNRVTITASIVRATTMGYIAQVMTMAYIARVTTMAFIAQAKSATIVACTLRVNRVTTNASTDMHCSHNACVG